MSNLKEILNAPETVIIDVRTEEEFAAGNVPGSLNIPLNTVPDHLDQFKAYTVPVVLCCRSGQRSQNAMEWLQSQGVDNLYNGMGYTDVLKEQNP
jgi:rhodanese-related sulfurtransferase